jgi:hypothetical protein
MKTESGGMHVNFFMSIMVLLLIIGIPLLKRTERSMIKKGTGETIQIEIKEKTNKLKVFMYILVAIVVLFVLKTEEVTLYLATMKLFFIVGLYFAEESLKTKIYLTNKGLYLVGRLKEKRLISMKQFSKSQLYRIDHMPKHKGVYRLYFNGNNNFLNTMDVKFQNKDDIALFRDLLNKNMGVYINEPVEIESLNVNPKRTELAAMSKLNLYFLISMTAFALFAVGKETIFSEEGFGGFSQLVASVVAMQFIPMVAYLAAYVFLKVSGMVSHIKDQYLSKRELFFLYVVGATTLPFVVLMNHGETDGTRFLTVHLLGLFLIGLLMISAWVVGKITKHVQRKNTQIPLTTKNPFRYLSK